ncbi:MAG TPA: hypothetical protein VKB51_10680 [bacterium]|nr:hypothetical protein [bacterium]
MEARKITQASIRAALARLRRAGGLIRRRPIAAPPSVGGIRPRGGHAIAGSLLARLGLLG